jgi:hypothetical protein|tara:strand:+ start:3469 stop:3609 length:141 start_codon:yes stop_codon:yes gene_type:complete
MWHDDDDGADARVTAETATRRATDHIDARVRKSALERGQPVTHVRR